MIEKDRIRSPQVHHLQKALETGNAQAVLDGDLDGFMESYLRQPK